MIQRNKATTQMASEILNEQSGLVTTVRENLQQNNSPWHVFVNLLG